MRVSREAMAEHHQEILTAAERMLRERGIKDTSVADLMQEAGRTHGGFYRHFASKDALVVEAVQSIFDKSLRALETQAGKAGAGEAVADYLAHDNVYGPGLGCPMAALGVDAMRGSAAVRKVFADGVRRTIDNLCAGLSGEPGGRRAKVLRLLASLVGAVIIARAVGDRELSEEVLAANREGLDAARPRD